MSFPPQLIRPEREKLLVDLEERDVIHPAAQAPAEDGIVDRRVLKPELPDGEAGGDGWSRQPLQIQHRQKREAPRRRTCDEGPRGMYAGGSFAGRGGKSGMMATTPHHANTEADRQRTEC